MNLLTKQKQIHTRQKQIYNYQRGKLVGEGWIKNLGLGISIMAQQKRI